jgi:hypothetical protein
MGKSLVNIIEAVYVAASKNKSKPTRSHSDNHQTSRCSASASPRKTLRPTRAAFLPRSRLGTPNFDRALKALDHMIEAEATERLSHYLTINHRHGTTAQC